MKKLCKSLIIVLCCLLFSGCDNSINETIEQISLNELLNKFYNQDTFILTISADQCEGCKKFDQIEEKTLQSSKLMTYNLKYDNLNQDNIKNLNKYVDKVEILPSVYYIVNGEVVEKFNYNGDNKAWKKWLRKIKTSQT